MIRIQVFAMIRWHKKNWEFSQNRMKNTFFRPYSIKLTLTCPYSIKLFIILKLTLD